MDVNIVKRPGNNNRCIVQNRFIGRASANDEVVFRFPAQPDAKIDFLATSPFDDPPVTILIGVARKIRTDAPVGSFGFNITWPNGGAGNGGGDVGP